MANRFITAHALPRGSLTKKQEAFLVKQTPEILTEHRQALNIFAPIPRLSKQQAFLLVRAIMASKAEARHE